MDRNGIRKMKGKGKGMAEVKAEKREGEVKMKGQD